MASSSPVASEKGTIASFSLLGTDVADGEDDMLLDMPTTEAAPAACGPCPPQAPHLGELRWVPLACNTPTGGRTPGHQGQPPTHLGRAAPTAVQWLGQVPLGVLQASGTHRSSPRCGAWGGQDRRCPLSWHKTVLSEVNTWLGFQVNPCGPVVDFPMDKRSTLKTLLHTIASGDSFTVKEIERALGRLNWATAAWPLSRPFLQPFWAWKSATTSSGKPSKLIRSFARLLLQLLHNPQIQPCPYDRASNWWGASDASAHPKDGAYIGGWIADCENPSKEQTWWFHYKVPLEDHPWAHKDGDPTRRIAALEMFGKLILTHFLLILVESRYSALGLVSSLTIKVTFLPSWTRRRSICQPRYSLCNSLSWSMLLGSNRHRRTWRGITIHGQMNLPILTSLAFALTGNYQWERLFPILNFCVLFWMTRRLPLNLRVTIPNVVRPTIMPPKVHWSQVAAADFLLTVVISHLTTLVGFSFARAQRSGGLGGLDVWHHHCILGFQMKPVLWWMRLASDRNPAAQANCIAKVPLACSSCLCLVSDIFNSIREHMVIFHGYVT